MDRNTLECCQGDACLRVRWALFSVADVSLTPNHTSSLACPFCSMHSPIPLIPRSVRFICIVPPCLVLYCVVLRCVALIVNDFYYDGF